MGIEIKDLPRIGQGTGDYFWNSGLDKKELSNLLREGVDLGMTLIDTAEVYGHGVSEEIVRDAVKGIRDKVTITTKFSPEDNKHFQIIDAVDRSLKRLGTDYIDIYQMHCTNPLVPFEETMHTLAYLKDVGKILRVGMCNLFLKELQECMGHERVDCLQIEYNVLERIIEDNGILTHCKDNGVLILAYSPLDLGRLPDSEVLRRIADTHGKTVAQVMVSWVIHNPEITTAIVRTTSRSHLKENADVVRFDLSEEEHAEINDAFPCNVVLVPTDEIRVSVDGEWGHVVYQTIDEALENRLEFVPSPAVLSISLREGDLLKPVRLVPSESSDYVYDLIGGRIRYWAWVIAHQGQRPIPAYIRGV